DTDEPRIAVAERTHRVEEMGDAADAVVESVLGFLRSRLRVAARDGDPAQVQEIDQLVRPGQLRRKRDEPDAARADETLEERRVGIAAPGRRVRPEPRRREERALEM